MNKDNRDDGASDEFSSLLDKNYYTPDKIADRNKHSEDDLGGKNVESIPSQKEKDLLQERGFFNPDKESNRPSRLSRFGNRKKITIGASIAGLIASLMIGIISYVPLQIAHIKEVFRGSYGGAQESTLVSRKMRLYNRAIFFTKDGEFDGYKERGAFRLIKNSYSNKLIDDLESRGFKVTAEKVNGRWTGRFRDIEYGGTKITNTNSSLWERRSAVRTALAEEYPARGFIWRSSQARKVYSRYGLNRSAWWNDNAATRKIDAIEVRFRQKVRDALSRKAPVDLGVDAPKSPTNEDGSSSNPDTDRANADAAAAAKAELDANTKASIDADVSSLEPPNPITELSDDAIKKGVGVASKSALGAIKITGTVEAACTGVRTLNQIEAGSRTIKRTQLLKSFTVYMSLVDAVRTGSVDSKDIGAFMSLMTSKDPKTGKNAYQSGAWMWASKGSGKEPYYGNTFNTGGGTTGTLKSFRTTAYGIVGGPSNVEGTCDTVSNGWFQIGSAAAGIGLSILTVGGFTGANLIANIAISSAVEMIRSFATPILTNLAAGTIVNGWEKGEKFGDMLGAASGSAYYTQGSQLGLRPLKKPEKAALMDEYRQMIGDEFKQKPLYARIFDLSDTRSVISVAVINSPRSMTDVTAILARPFGFLSSKVFATENGYECNDEEIVANNIATDPFCNPILGETGLTKIDPIDNFKWMLDNQYVSDDGTPQGEYAEYVSKCFENSNIETLFDVKDFTTTFNDTCISSGENDKYLRFRAYRVDSGLLDCMVKELDQGHCDDNTPSSLSDGPKQPFGGIEGMNCAGYQALTSKPAVIENGKATNVSLVSYSDLVRSVCERTKQECLSGVSGTTKALCASYEFHDSWYGNQSYKTPSGESSNSVYYGVSQPINALFDVKGWYENRKPGLNGNNLLECSALTSVAVYKAFGYSNQIGCSGNWGQRANPSLFKQITWSEIQPGDFVTYSQTCALSTSRFGHVAIVASPVDSNGDFVVFEQASYGTTAHFRKTNINTWGINRSKGITTFSGNLSRWIGPGI